MCNHKLATPK